MGLKLLAMRWELETSKMLEPIVRTIEVPCDQTVAFEIFVEEVGSWWPLARFTQSAMAGVAALNVVIEPQVGGAVYEITPDGSKVVWGIVDAYEPSTTLSMQFHIPLPKENVKERSLVTVQFESISATRTKVTLTQTNWEAFGKRGSMLHGGYGLGWAHIFDECYAAACTQPDNQQTQGNK